MTVVFCVALLLGFAPVAHEDFVIDQSGTLWRIVDDYTSNMMVYDFSGDPVHFSASVTVSGGGPITASQDSWTSETRLTLTPYLGSTQVAPAETFYFDSAQQMQEFVPTWHDVVVDRITYSNEGYWAVDTPIPVYLPQSRRVTGCCRTNRSKKQRRRWCSEAAAENASTIGCGQGAGHELSGSHR